MSVRNILKIIPIFLISTYTEAGFIESIKAKTLGNSVPFFLECVNNLKNQKITEFKANNLCVDKYAGMLDISTDGKDTATKSGTVKFRVINSSNSFVVNKVEYSGYVSCPTENYDDKPLCEYQSFDVTKYIKLTPHSDKSITLYDQFKISEDLVKGEWTWYGKIDKAYGFSLDY